MVAGSHCLRNQESAGDSSIGRFEGVVSSASNGFGRMIFKGFLPFHNEARLNGFVDRVPKIRRKDFTGFSDGMPAISSPMGLLPRLRRWKTCGRNAAS